MTSSKNAKQRQNRMNSKVLHIVCAAALVFSMMPTYALTAWADEGNTQAIKATEIASSDDSGALYTDAFDSLGGTNASYEASLAESLPSKVDLREDGYVTNVKFQSPWGSCWAFSIIAAAEVSILSELEATTSEYALNLSEHHLSWFTKNHLATKGEEGYDPVNVQYQSGEGVWSTTEQRRNDSMNSGTAFYGTSSFGAGIGAVEEDVNPGFRYQGTQGKILARNADGSKATFNSRAEAIAAGYTPWYYSSEDDWTLSEDLRFYQSYELEESSILPNITKQNAAGEWEYNGDIATGQNEGVNAIKKQLNEKRAVSIAYKSDQGRSQDTSRYINTTNWAHYTWEFGTGTSHAVTIVGYDDTYSKENFTITPAKWDSSRHAIYKLTDEGAILNNDASAGNAPYLTDADGNKVYFETSSEYIEPTSTPGTYQIKSDYRELTNDANGNSLIPGTDKVLGNRNDLCEVAKENQSYTPEGDGAWIVKNSWGSGTEDFPNYNPWGNDGYFYISYYDKSVRKAESFDFIIGDEEEEYETGYTALYDFLPTHVVYDITDVDEISMANVFTAEFSDTTEEDYKTVNLSGMACNTSTPGTTVKYQLYILNDDYTSPTDGTCAITLTETYEYGGYHRVTFNPVMVPVGQKYSIVVTQTAINASTGETKYLIPYGAASKVPNQNGFYSQAVVNKGESFIMRTDDEGTPVTQDWADFIVSDEFIEIVGTKVFNTYAVDNLPLKAYGIPYESSPDTVSSSGASFVVGTATTDAIFTFGEGLDGFSTDNFNAQRGVTIDGTQLASNNYTIRDGSIKLTLFKDYLNTLTAGTHTVRVYLEDSTALTGVPDYVEATISVSEKAAEPTSPTSPTSSTSQATSPKTSDVALCTFASLFALVAFSGAGIGVSLLRRRKQ